jgi:hypothetical protein
VAKAFSGAQIVKGLNHLPAEQLCTIPSIQGQRQVVFLSSNNADAAYFGRGGQEQDKIGFIDGDRQAVFGCGYAKGPDVLIEQLGRTRRSPGPIR